MFNNMLSYQLALLSGIADFLSSEPMIYIFGFLCVALTVKIFLRIMNFGKGGF